MNPNYITEQAEKLQNFITKYAIYIENKELIEKQARRSWLDAVLNKVPEKARAPLAYGTGFAVPYAEWPAWNYYNQKELIEGKSPEQIEILRQQGKLDLLPSGFEQVLTSSVSSLTLGSFLRKFRTNLNKITSPETSPGKRLAHVGLTVGATPIIHASIQAQSIPDRVKAIVNRTNASQEGTAKVMEAITNASNHMNKLVAIAENASDTAGRYAAKLEPIVDAATTISTNSIPAITKTTDTMKQWSKTTENIKKWLKDNKDLGVASGLGAASGLGLSYLLDEDTDKAKSELELQKMKDKNAKSRLWFTLLGGATGGIIPKLL